MGLDSVEMVMKVEKTFGIRIPDQEAEKILTVADFHDTVWRYVDERVLTRCKSQALFYGLRKSVEEEFRVPHKTIGLHSNMNLLLPLENRRKIYRRFAETNNLQFPPLVLPVKWIRLLNAFGYISILGGLFTSWLLHSFFNYSIFIYWIPLAGTGLTFLLSLALNGKRMVIEPASVKHFTRTILMLNYAKIVGEEGISRREMEMVINQIISDMTGLPLEEVLPGAKFGDDLGID